MHAQQKECIGMTNKVLRVCAAASMRNPIPLHWDKDISLSKGLLMMWGFRWYLEPARNTR